MAKNSDADRPTTVVLFDGDCGMCHGAVRFTLRHERDEVLKFASLDSDYARRELAERGFPEPPPDTVVVLHGDRILVRSDAALRIAAHLKAPWRWLRILRIIPRPLRDALYDFIARRRHRWFPPPQGVCPMPGPATKARFLA